MSWHRPNIGSRMNREVHVRVWERAEVKFLRATRQNPHSSSALARQLSAAADIDRPERAIGSSSCLCHPMCLLRLPEAQKREDLAQLEAALKDARPIQFKENIAMVLKYFDQLPPLFQEEGRAD